MGHSWSPLCPCAGTALTLAMCLLTLPRWLSLSLSSSICSSPDSSSTTVLPSIIMRLLFSQCRPLKAFQDGGGMQLLLNISMTHRSMCSKRVSHVFNGFMFLLSTTGPAVFELVCRICVMLNNHQTTCDSSEATQNTCPHEQTTVVWTTVLHNREALRWWSESLIWLRAENGFVDMDFSLPVQTKARKSIFP